MKYSFIYIILFLVFSQVTGCKKDLPSQNEDEDNDTPKVLDIYTFYHENRKYEIVKEKSNWEEAAAIAVERGGMLVEIMNKDEQNAIYSAAFEAEIELDMTVAPDGGMASYLWTGGTDAVEEGSWYWNGNNDDNLLPFWKGEVDGQAIGDAYTNWGNEPDNYTGQDGLGLALTDWPRGEAGQWNDIKLSNQLYFIIEY